jgi:hypothetical protein
MSSTMTTAAVRRRLDRFVNKAPSPLDLPTAAWINRPRTSDDQLNDLTVNVTKKVDRFRGRNAAWTGGTIKPITQVRRTGYQLPPREQARHDPDHSATLRPR